MKKTYQGTYIKFVEGPSSKSGKTKTWWVVQKQKGIHLGWIAWWGGWRRYGFYPKEKTVFEEVCLKDITEFIVTRTKEHRAFAKYRREQSRKVVNVAVKAEVPVRISWEPDPTDSKITHVNIYKKPAR